MTSATSALSLRILLSVYACEPGKGSEAGVGWHWAVEMARLGHRVSVLTRLNNRDLIEAALAAPEASAYAGNLKFIYCDLPAWARWWKRNGRGVHLYYVLWQWLAYRVARRAHRSLPFDAVHHLTFGVLRHPSLMGRLGIPFVAGPLGGGEVTPPLLRRALPRPSRWSEWLRDMANLVCRYDPLVRAMYRDADVILCKTPASLAWLPAHCRPRARCLLEIGVDAKPQAGKVAPSVRGPLRLLYVGRFLSWKGMDIGLRAVARLRARGIGVTLTLIGKGPEGERWRALAAASGIEDAVTWVEWMKQDELMKTYATFDALLFPSLHDSSGNVVLEALSHGLPVVCLDVGGPAEIVDETCGMRVGTSGKTVEQVVEALARSLDTLSARPEWCAALRDGARQRASAFAWETVVGRVWAADGVGTKLVQAAHAYGAYKLRPQAPSASLRAPVRHAASRDEP
jgi:glycosyltransferase involved in cell wall biosynthesis